MKVQKTNFRFPAVFLLAGAVLAQTPPPLSPDALRVEVSYLASDYLKGRNTPSPELDEAAEFIASQFARAGLQPAGGEGFFQNAEFQEATVSEEGFELTLGGVSLPFSAVRVSNAVAAGLANAPLRKVDLAAAKSMKSAEGTILLAEWPDTRGAEPADRASIVTAMGELRREVQRLKPAAVIYLGPRGPGRPVRPSLVEVDAPAAPFPILNVTDRAAAKQLEALPQDATATLKLAAPRVRPVRLRNVIGVMRGSDPDMARNCLVVSAHYDHVGADPAIKGDGIFNGANDDASGTASLIEIAAALAPMKPARTIVFAAFFGEEKGLLGSRWYTRHPVFPLSATVADINLEQLGRTDETSGPRAGKANFTGYDYTDIPVVFEAAGKPLGVEFFRDEKNSDRYFGGSDNLSFAQVGVPAHTISVTYMFPDYHRPGDEWNKLDYDNMALVGRAIAAGILALANRPEPPKWKSENPKAAPFAKAGERRPTQ